ncbi:membrane protein [Streptomyces sp. SPB074]|nr:membrane protein [Streptomyces sp. SPB074]
MILVAAGCSSGSGDEGKAKDDAKQSAAAGSGKNAKNGASASPDASATATVRAKYAKLPEPCTALSAKTLKALVPAAKDTKGSQGSSDDLNARGTCSWNSLDSNGVHGSQYRWLSLALVRFDSDATLGTGDERAAAYLAKQITATRATAEAKDLKSEKVAGLGDEATAVTYALKKKEGDFEQQTLLVRTANAVLTLDYNGAGLAGEKTPDPAKLRKDAERAAGDAVAAVASANGGAGSAPGDAGTGSGDASKGASASPGKSESPEKDDAGKKDEDKKPDADPSGKDGTSSASPKASASKSAEAEKSAG